MIPNNIQVSTETLIHPQLNDKFVVDLEDSLKKMIGLKYTSKRYKEEITVIENLVYERFKIPITISNHANGFSCIPVMSLEDTVLKTIGDVGKKSSEYKKLQAIKQWLHDNVIKVDLVHATIINFPKEIKNRFFIVPDEIMNQNQPDRLTTMEIVAIFLHEIGHIFTFVETYIRTVKTNSMLLEAFTSYKKDLKKDISFTFDPDIDKKNTSIDVKMLMQFKKNIDTSILQLSSQMGAKSESETQADDFAVRFGIGEYLSSSLVKSFDIFYYTLPMMLWVQFASLFKIFVVYMFILSPFTKLFLIFILVYLFLTSLLKESGFSKSFPYEKITDRIDYLKINMIKILRTYNLTNEEKKQIISSIDQVNANLNVVHDKGWGTLLSKFLDYGTNMGKTFDDEQILTKILNSVINNELYYYAEKIAIANENSVYFASEITTSNEDISSDGKEIVYVSKVEYDSRKLLFLENSKVLSRINEELEKYGFKIDSVKQGEIFVFSKHMFTVSTGAFTLAFDDTTTDTICLVTSDKIKVLWGEENPYMNIVEMEEINVNKLKSVYFMVSENVSIYGAMDSKERKKYKKVIDRIYALIDKYYRDYGEGSAYEVINSVVTSLHKDRLIPKEVVEQFNILKDLVKNSSDSNTTYIDVHEYNIGVSKDNKIVLIDPVANFRLFGNKVNNKINIGDKK